MGAIKWGLDYVGGSLVSNKMFYVETDNRKYELSPFVSLGEIYGWLDGPNSGE